MATHSSILAWRIPWAEEHGGCSLWSGRVRKDWAHTQLLPSYTQATPGSFILTFKFHRSSNDIKLSSPKLDCYSLIRLFWSILSELWQCSGYCLLSVEVVRDDTLVRAFPPIPYFSCLFTRKSLRLLQFHSFLHFSFPCFLLISTSSSLPFLFSSHISLCPSKLVFMFWIYKIYFLLFLDSY